MTEANKLKKSCCAFYREVHSCHYDKLAIEATVVLAGSAVGYGLSLEDAKEAAAYKLITELLDITTPVEGESYVSWLDRQEPKYSVSYTKATGWLASVTVLGLTLHGDPTDEGKLAAKEGAAVAAIDALLQRKKEKMSPPRDEVSSPLWVDDEQQVEGNCDAQCLLTRDEELEDRKKYIGWYVALEAMERAENADADDAQSHQWHSCDDDIDVSTTTASAEPHLSSSSSACTSPGTSIRPVMSGQRQPIRAQCPDLFRSLTQASHMPPGPLFPTEPGSTSSESAGARNAKDGAQNYENAHARAESGDPLEMPDRPVQMHTEPGCWPLATAPDADVPFRLYTHITRLPLAPPRYSPYSAHANAVRAEVHASASNAEETNALRREGTMVDVTSEADGRHHVWDDDTNKEEDWIEHEVVEAAPVIKYASWQQNDIEEDEGDELSSEVHDVHADSLPDDENKWWYVQGEEDGYAGYDSQEDDICNKAAGLVADSAGYDSDEEEVRDEVHDIVPDAPLDENAEDEYDIEENIMSHELEGILPDSRPAEEHDWYMRGEESDSVLYESEDDDGDDTDMDFAMDMHEDDKTRSTRDEDTGEACSKPAFQVAPPWHVGTVNFPRLSTDVLDVTFNDHIGLPSEIVPEDSHGRCWLRTESARILCLDAEEREFLLLATMKSGKHVFADARKPVSIEEFDRYLTELSFCDLDGADGCLDSLDIELEDFLADDFFSVGRHCELEDERNESELVEGLLQELVEELTKAELEVASTETCEDTAPLLAQDESMPHAVPLGAPEQRKLETRVLHSASHNSMNQRLRLPFLLPHGHQKQIEVGYWTTVRPTQILFSQDSICPRFRCGQEVRAMVFKDNTEMLKGGLRLVNIDGKLFSLSNRRLALFRMMEFENLLTECKGFVLSTPPEREIQMKFTTKCGGLYCEVRDWKKTMVGLTKAGTTVRYDTFLPKELCAQRSGGHKKTLQKQLKVFETPPKPDARPLPVMKQQFGLVEQEQSAPKAKAKAEASSQLRTLQRMPESAFPRKVAQSPRLPKAPQPRPKSAFPRKLAPAWKPAKTLQTMSKSASPRKHAEPWRPAKAAQAMPTSTSTRKPAVPSRVPKVILPVIASGSARTHAELSHVPKAPQTLPKSRSACRPAESWNAPEVPHATSKSASAGKPASALRVEKVPRKLPKSLSPRVHGAPQTMAKSLSARKLTESLNQRQYASTRAKQKVVTLSKPLRQKYFTQPTYPASRHGSAPSTPHLPSNIAHAGQQCASNRASSSSSNDMRMERRVASPSNRTHVEHQFGQHRASSPHDTHIKRRHPSPRASSPASTHTGQRFSAPSASSPNNVPVRQRFSAHRASSPHDMHMECQRPSPHASSSNDTHMGNRFSATNQTSSSEVRQTEDRFAPQSVSSSGAAHAESQGATHKASHQQTAHPWEQRCVNTWNQNCMDTWDRSTTHGNSLYSTRYNQDTLHWPQHFFTTSSGVSHYTMQPLGAKENNQLDTFFVFNNAVMPKGVRKRAPASPIKSLPERFGAERPVHY